MDMSPEAREEFLKSPALAAPSGVVANFDNPRNSFSYAFPLFLLVFILSNVVFATRMYVQLRVIRKMQVEDYVLILGWVVYAFAWSPVAIMICFLPVGMHQWNIRMEQFMRHMFLYNTSLIMYAVVIIFIKVNILLQYVRIFAPTGTRNFTYWASHVLIWVNAVYYLLSIFLLIFICTPRTKLWDPTIQGGHCLDWPVISTFSNVVTLISDLMIWLLPQRVIFSLQLSRSRKIGLSLLFTIGIFACISASVRLHYHFELLRDRSDTTFLLSRICFCGTTELTAGFLVACMTAAPMMFNHIRKQSWAVRVRSTFRTLFHISRSDNQALSEPPTTIGGRKHKHDVKARVATDIEFEELVQRTDNFSMISVSQTNSGTTRRGDNAV
ncbi:hypothetical protein K469DRAFT_710387 [Zopfia rhizophila CBS 207.26]|uniref:Rhodopsin domain-containing protein n=1 Tax=Zopfia rhizophila CBS 207.26 TaxID=1314779 RepID=A0A6A6E022_9PEZI|nr:hypothetical protein K469DRAFT_710387 [Zopfia rhizophila CBS 207.26]